MLTTSRRNTPRRAPAGPAPAYNPPEADNLQPQLLTVLSCAKIVGTQVFDDMRAAGWIQPRAVKQNPIKPRPFFALVDLRACEARMLRGEYPDWRNRR